MAAIVAIVGAAMGSFGGSGERPTTSTTLGGASGPTGVAESHSGGNPKGPAGKGSRPSLRVESKPPPEQCAPKPASYYISTRGPTAYEVDNKEVTAYGPLQSGRLYRAGLQGSGDLDFYVFCTGQPTIATVEVRPTTGDLNQVVSVHLLNESGDELQPYGEYGDPNSPSRFQKVLSKPGRYFLEISDYGSADTGPYEFSVDSPRPFVRTLPSSAP